MSSETRPTPGAGHPARLNDRIQFVTDLLLRTDSGRLHSGHTTDVSLTGAFLHTEAPPEGLTVGETGVAAVTVLSHGQEVNMAFPCTVARITPGGIGLHFHDVDAEEEWTGENDDVGEVDESTTLEPAG
ncbi:MAG: PilZ domain-containing protein [Magnetococcales bacterium]|nr:PilZ domain-containing protein [Magnetococcales bacterium]